MISNITINIMHSYKGLAPCGQLTVYTSDCKRTVAEFKEFKRRFKFKPRFKYG